MIQEEKIKLKTFKNKYLAMFKLHPVYAVETYLTSTFVHEYLNVSKSNVMKYKQTEQIFE